MPLDIYIGIQSLVGECDLIWRFGFYRGNQVKKKVDWTLIEYEICSFKKREI
jgi:hypothetical protein